MKHDLTHRGLLDALHLWLHRDDRSDEPLALACRLFDWSTLPGLDLLPREREALTALERWHLGHRVDLIGAAEDFHEACTDCDAVAARAAKLDAPPADPQHRLLGTMPGHVLNYHLLSCLRQWHEVVAYLQRHGHHLVEVEVGVWQLHYKLRLSYPLDEKSRREIQRWISWQSVHTATTPEVWQAPIDEAARELGLTPGHE